MMPIEWFEKTPIEKIKENLKIWDQVRLDLEEGKIDQNNRFEMDQYNGYSTNSGHAYWYLAGYERGLDKKK